MAQAVKIHQLICIGLNMSLMLFAGLLLMIFFYVMYSECCILRCVKKEYLINIPTQLTDENSIIVT